jgi:hypothetical protein
MRNGQNKRMRGRNRNNNNNRSHNPLTKVFESNGPDVKIRGTASHVAEKYIQLARDAQSSGDPVAAENYYQHAEHYFRLIAAAQEQFRQSPQYNQGQSSGNDMREGSQGNDMREGSGNDMREGSYDEDGDDEGDIRVGNEQPQFGTRDPQPVLPRESQFAGEGRYQQQQQPRQQHNNGQQNGNHDDSHVDRLPSFITGGQQQQPQEGQQNGPGDNGDRFQGDRNERYGFRRRRHRRGGPRSDNQGAQAQESGDDVQG